MGIVDLPYAVELNSISETPKARYDAEDAGASNWTANGYGVTLTLSGSGSDPTLDDGAPTMGSTDTSVLFVAAKYYQAGDTTTGNVGTNDFVISGVAKSTGTTCVLFAKRNAGVGWEVGINASDQLYLTIEDSSGSTTVVSAALTSGRWFFFGIYADRSGSAQIYINNAASGSPVAISGRTLTLDSSTALTIGADSGGSSPCDTNIAHVALWSRAAWLDTHLQLDATIERLARLAGTHPEISEGTALWAQYVRTTQAYVDKIESAGVRRLYAMEPGWPRVCSRYETDGATERVGYLSEDSFTNRCLYSEQIDHSQWTKYLNKLTVSANQAIAPTGETTADLIRETASGYGIYSIFQAFFGLSTVRHIWAVWVKAINRIWVLIQWWSSADGLRQGWFNLSTGEVGTEVALDDAGIDDYGNGWYRCWISDTFGTPGGATVYLYPCEADGSASMTGVDQDCLYMWGGYVEANSGAVPGSYVPTVAGTVTRNADELRFKGDDGNLNNLDRIGAMELRLMGDNLGGKTGSGNMLFDLSDGGSAADRITCYADATGVVQVASAATGGSAGAVSGTTNVIDGDEHSVLVSWQDNALRLFVDGVEDGTVDTDCDIPDDLDRIDVGINRTGDWNADCLVYDIRIYDRQRLV